MKKIILVNNTRSDIRIFDRELIQAVKEGVLPEELADLFTLEIIETETERKGILNHA